MLSVIVDVGAEAEALPGLLAALTSAAVDGLVREVTLAGGAPSELLAVLREETGAELAADLAQAVAAAKADLLLVAGADFRPRLGWVEALGRHLRGGGREALVAGEGGGLLRAGPYALVIARSKAAGLAHPDLKRLRRAVGRDAARLG